MEKNVDLKDIISFLESELMAVYGELDSLVVRHLRDPEHVDEFTLDWINPAKQEKQKVAEASKAKVIIVDKEVVFSETLKNQGKVLLVVDNPKLAISKVGNEFFVEKSTPGIHPSAIIHPDAKIGENVFVGANTVIENCTIGDDTIIDANVHIYSPVIIGKHCVVKSGAVLGGMGFGFEKDENGNLFRFPQIGNLFIGDYVEIGANTCIDRGALSDTIIGDYCKINNLCHIAHNNKIGKNVVITAQVNISGSNVIEDDVWIAPNATIRGWITIGKGATIGMGSVVTKDVPAGETWVGNPARKLEK
ncbi:MAG TPA: UDP-3-O-(3-hydroxymyristoyl)glucosamine N-acyltransferase [Paludibacteraceae bacterium]|nr:UDP-3-O-(3-hydroxymyristoyl)glucosamine N-acyltransferase [Paludibacteraceae bacterium]